MMSVQTQLAEPLIETDNNNNKQQYRNNRESRLLVERFSISKMLSSDRELHSDASKIHPRDDNNNHPGLQLQHQRDESIQTPPPQRNSNDEYIVVRTNNNSNIGAAEGGKTNQVWYRNPQQIMAMISNFSTSYNVVNISLVLPILQQLHSDSNSEEKSAIASSLLAGMVVGQLVGGALGDSVYLGRLGALQLVMVIQVIGSLASACVGLGPWLLSATTTHKTISTQEFYIALAFWRFVLGIGAGGVYPLAAVLSGEQQQRVGNSTVAESTSSTNPDAHKDSKLSNVVLTFSMQGIGFVAVPLVAVLLLDTQTNLTVTWRLLLALGSIPGIIILVMHWCIRGCSSSSSSSLRHGMTPIPQSDHRHDDEVGDATNLHLVETPDATPAEEIVDGVFRSSEGRDHRDEEETNSLPTHQARAGWFRSIRNEPQLIRKLIGTAGTWFFFDVLFYGNTLFQPIVIQAAFGKAHSSSGAYDILRKTATDSLILTSIALPGYFVAALLLGKQTCCITQTPRYVTLQGFLAMSILYFTIGTNWDYLRHVPMALVILYGLTFFFANYGPNTTTFVLPSLVYSPSCRSTLNGISAAAGKAGALVGATLFAPVAEHLGDAAVMKICAVVGIVAALLTFCFVRVPSSSDSSDDQALLDANNNTHESDADLPNREIS